MPVLEKNSKRRNPLKLKTLKHKPIKSKKSTKRKGSAGEDDYRVTALLKVNSLLHFVDFSVNRNISWS